MRWKKVYFAISALILVPGILSLILFGLNPSIDFTGGTLWEIRFTSDVEEKATSESIKDIFENRELDIEIQASGERQFLVKTSPLETKEHQELSELLESSVGPFSEVRFETLGPKLGGELLRKALTAVFLAILAILAYVAFRFKDFAYGAVAILAMLHDTLILLGTFSILGHFWDVKIGTLFVVAVLTTLSFSVHDTIVVFDRIREILGKTDLEFAKAVNQAVGETLVRSINNSLTIIFMLLALLILGGETLRIFVLALLVGTISGTYSSTFTAAPLLVVWHEASKRLGWKGIFRLH